jgi:hypothetical protein
MRHVHASRVPPRAPRTGPAASGSWTLRARGFWTRERAVSRAAEHMDPRVRTVVRWFDADLAHKVQRVAKV